MNCILCDSPLLESDKKMEYECGCHTVHSKCIVKEAYKKGTAFAVLQCNTCYIDLIDFELDIYEDNNTTGLTDRVRNLLTNSNFKNDLLKIKNKYSEFSKLNAICNKNINDHYNNFREANATNISNINISKRNTINEIKSSNDFLDHRRAYKNFFTSLSNFSKKYNLNWAEILMLKLRHVNRRRFITGANKIARKFRIVI